MTRRVHRKGGHGRHPRQVLDLRWLDGASVIITFGGSESCALCRALGIHHVGGVVSDADG